VGVGPSNAAAHYYLALGMSEVDLDNDGAILEIRKSIMFNPTEASTHLGSGSLLALVRDNHTGTTREFHKAIQCDPDVPELNFQPRP
jgi:hypothetical protein